MRSSTLTRSLLIFGLGLAALAIGVGAWFWTQVSPQQAARSGTVTATGTASIGGPFELVDQNGQTRTDGDFRGRFMLIYFGFTFCPDICPASLFNMTQALDYVADSNPDAAAKIVPVFITVDPERDTVSAMGSYAEHFHPEMVALTGSQEQVAAAAKAYRVFYAKVEDGDASEYLMDHSSFIYLMGTDGEYLAHFAHNSLPDDIAAALARFAGS